MLIAIKMKQIGLNYGGGERASVHQAPSRASLLMFTDHAVYQSAVLLMWAVNPRITYLGKAWIFPFGCDEKACYSAGILVSQGLFNSFLREVWDNKTFIQFSEPVLRWRTITDWLYPGFWARSSLHTREMDLNCVYVLLSNLELLRSSWTYCQVCLASG